MEKRKRCYGIFHNTFFLLFEQGVQVLISQILKPALLKITVQSPILQLIKLRLEEIVPSLTVPKIIVRSTPSSIAMV